MSLSPRTRLEGGQMGFVSSDMGFWDDFGFQMRGRAHSDSIQNRSATGFRANNDFVQPSHDFCRFSQDLASKMLENLIKNRLKKTNG